MSIGLEEPAPSGEGGKVGGGDGVGWLGEGLHGRPAPERRPSCSVGTPSGDLSWVFGQRRGLVFRQMGGCPLCPLSPAGWPPSTSALTRSSLRCTRSLTGSPGDQVRRPLPAGRLRPGSAPLLPRAGSAAVAAAGSTGIFTAPWSAADRIHFSVPLILTTHRSQSTARGPATSALGAHALTSCARQKALRAQRGLDPAAV